MSTIRRVTIEEARKSLTEGFSTESKLRVSHALDEELRRLVKEWYEGPNPFDAQVGYETMKVLRLRELFQP